MHMTLWMWFLVWSDSSWAKTPAAPPPLAGDLTLALFDSYSYDAAYQQLAERKRLAAMEDIKSALSKASDEKKPELMLQLAELYFWQGHMLYLREGRPLDIERSASREWLEQAIKLYTVVLQEHPRDKGADQATFYLGFAREELGMKAEAASTFAEILKHHPASAFVPESYLHLGEYHSGAEGNVLAALKAYLKASTYTDSPHYTYAMYKLGWCYRNVGEHDKALATMQTLSGYLAKQKPDATTAVMQQVVQSALIQFGSP